MSPDHPYKNLQLAQLRGFCAVALEGNFTAAARTLGTPVPTLWQQVRSLERKLGVALLWRRGRSLDLTPEGRLLLELVQPHVNGLESLARVFEARRGSLPPYLTVAATHYLLCYHLPPALRDCLTDRRQVRVRLRAGSWAEVVRQVEQGEADLGVAPCAGDGERSAKLEYERLFELQFMLLTRPDHPLARKRRLTPADLVRYPLLLGPNETHGRRTLESLLRKHDLHERAHRVLEGPTTDLLHRHVSLGVGIALGYMAAGAGSLMPGVALRPFDARLDPLPVFLLVRPGDRLPEQAEAFRGCVRRALRGGARRAQA
jgi:DNA-binding transcriptional LysR family regulator